MNSETVSALSAPKQPSTEAKEASKGSNALPIVLGVIIVLGGLLAAGLSYTTIHEYAFLVGGSGVILGVFCGCLGKRLQSNSAAQPSHTRSTDPYKWRAEVYRETLKACEDGYRIGERLIEIDNASMQAHTETYDNLNPLPGNPGYGTQFSVIEDDTFNVLVALKKAGVTNPVGINMANRFKAGGGVEDGCPAQEEALCRRSNHVLGLKNEPYPMPEEGGIYCPHVQIFREDEKHDFAFMEEPQEVSLVAIAAFDLRIGASDRTKCFLPKEGEITPEILQENTVYSSATKKKIRHMLRIMAIKGHTDIVLGALGCGAFKTPPQVMAKLFKEVFLEQEFHGRFKQVIFAILNIFPKDKENIQAFNQLCAELGPRA